MVFLYCLFTCLLGSSEEPSFTRYIFYHLFLLLIRWPEVYELYWSYEPALDLANFFYWSSVFRFIDVPNFIIYIFQFAFLGLTLYLLFFSNLLKWKYRLLILGPFVFIFILNAMNSPLGMASTIYIPHVVLSFI